MTRLDRESNHKARFGFERKSKELESFIADQFAEYNDWTFAENNNGEKSTCLMPNFKRCVILLPRLRQVAQISFFS